MGLFETFPYTNFHELNLDKLIQIILKYKEDVERQGRKIEELDKEFKDLKAYVINYFDNLDIQEEVNNKLDEMLADGTLEEIINGRVYGTLLHYVPEEEENEEYRDNVRKTLVNWLERNHGADYFAENQAITETVPITVKYATGKGYNGLYRGYKFVTEDTFEASDGVNCNVCYMDCTTFVSLIQKNILWNNSPYYEMMVNNDKIAATKSGLITFTNTRGSKPYLTDAYGDITTYQEAFILDMSGNGCLRLSKKTRTPATSEGVEKLIVNEEMISRLKTGDIIWVGDNAVAPNGIDRAWFYKAIHHDAIYVRDLEELNALTHNVKFKLSDSAVGSRPEFGYVVHCTNESSDYKNGLRIITLYDLINHLPSYAAYKYPDGRPAERGVYYTSGAISNTAADSRNDFFGHMQIRAGNKTFWRAGLSASETDDTETALRAKEDYFNGTFEAYSVGSKGARLRRTSIDHENKKYIYDANLYTVNGHYTIPNETLPEGYTREFRNFPKFVLTDGQLISCEIYISGFRRGDASGNYEWLIEDQISNNTSAGVQIIITNSRGRVCMRGTTDNGTFRNWQYIGSKTLYGISETVTVPAGEILDLEIPYTEEGDEISYNFINTPQVQVTPRYTSQAQCTVENLANTGVMVYSRALSKLVVRFYNNTQNNINMSCYWRAYD